MKHLSNILVVIVLILAVVFGFTLLWQKQQNAHEEKMRARLLPTSLASETNSEITVIDNNKTTRQKISEALQSTIAFILGVFSKL